MGVLDEAIRDHLELARRRGASDEEIATKEAEALGPARREFPAGGADGEPALGEAVLDEPVLDESAVDELVTDEAALGEAALGEAEDVSLDEEQLVPEEEELLPDDGVFVEEVPAEERLSEASVLEETPDFLEETPEHDRLWFEQKPPRDFDFDD